MTLLRPTADPVGRNVADAEAVIREARRRRRRRVTRRAVLVGLISAGTGWALAGSVGGPSRSATTGPGSAIAAAGTLPEGPYANLEVAGPLAVAPSGALYVVDTATEQVLVRLASGRFRVVAGDGHTGVSGDGGPAIDAAFLDISDLAVASDGSVYIVDGDRVRKVSPSGTITTVAGVPGVPSKEVGRAPSPIANSTPARSVSITQMNSASIALSEQGQLYISTGMQLLRLVRGRLDVVRVSVVHPPFPGFRFNGPGQIALDGAGNLDVSGVNGYMIWQIARDGAAMQLTTASAARRSGGNTSVLERAPDGTVYGESGPTLLRLQDHRAVSAHAFPDDFWLTYFAFGPGGTIYADEIPGGSAFERYQQLRVVRGSRSSVLWRQSAGDLAHAAHASRAHL